MATAGLASLFLIFDMYHGKTPFSRKNPPTFTEGGAAEVHKAIERGMDWLGKSKAANKRRSLHPPFPRLQIAYAAIFVLFVTNAMTCWIGGYADRSFSTSADVSCPRKAFRVLGPPPSWKRTSS